MANTTNFGWETPDDTDLVKDGAAAMRTLGNSIDASFVDLKGGTTGQILSKASNTDLDYTWINNDQGDITEVVAGTGISGGGTSGSVTVTNSMATAIDAKGDLIAGTGADAFARLGVGTDGQVLSASSGAATGLAWTTLSTGGLTQIATVTHNDSVTSWDVQNIASTYTHLLIVGQGLQSNASNAVDLKLIINNDTGANYSNSGIINDAGTIASQNSWVASANGNYLARVFGQTADASTRFGSFWMMIPNYTSATQKSFNAVGYAAAAGTSTYTTAAGTYNSTSAINRITLSTGSATKFKAGIFTLYGVK